MSAIMKIGDGRHTRYEDMAGNPVDRDGKPLQPATSITRSSTAEELARIFDEVARLAEKVSDTATQASLKQAAAQGKEKLRLLK